MEMALVEIVDIRYYFNETEMAICKFPVFSLTMQDEYFGGKGTKLRRLIDTITNN